MHIKALIISSYKTYSNYLSTFLKDDPDISLEITDTPDIEKIYENKYNLLTFWY